MYSRMKVIKQWALPLRISVGSGEESLCIYWLHWIFIVVRGLSLVVESRGHPLAASHCTGFSVAGQGLYGVGASVAPHVCSGAGLTGSRAQA